MRSLLLIMVVCVVSIAAGCGGSTGPVGPQSQVSGTVTNDGKPVTLNSQIVFFNSEKGLTLSGVLDSLGKYTLSAADPKLGVPAGRYDVKIIPPVTPVVDVNQSSTDYSKMMQAGGATLASAASANLAPDIPEKFRDTKTSKLVFEIKEGANTFDLDLSKL